MEANGHADAFNLKKNKDTELKITAIYEWKSINAITHGNVLVLRIWTDISSARNSLRRLRVWVSQHQFITCVDRSQDLQPNQICYMQIKCTYNNLHIRPHKSYWYVALIFHFEYIFNFNMQARNTNKNKNKKIPNEASDALTHCSRNKWRKTKRLRCRPTQIPFSPSTQTNEHENCAISVFMFMHYILEKKIKEIYPYCFMIEKKTKRMEEFKLWPSQIVGEIMWNMMFRLIYVSMSPEPVAIFYLIFFLLVCVLSIYYYTFYVIPLHI